MFSHRPTLIYTPLSSTSHSFFNSLSQFPHFFLFLFTKPIFDSKKEDLTYRLVFLVTLLSRISFAVTNLKTYHIYFIYSLLLFVINCHSCCHQRIGGNDRAPLTRSIGVGGGALTPSTPQIIEFPLMTDEDFIPPVERNPGNYAVSITSPVLAQTGSNRPPSTFPMIQDPNTLSVRSVNSINSLTNLPPVTSPSPSIPAVPTNSPTMTTPQRGTGRNSTLPVRLSDNDEDSILSSQRMQNYDSFDEEWGI